MREPAIQPEDLPPAEHLASLAAPLSSPHPRPLHSGMSIERFYAMHALGASFLVVAGLAFYGWRALAAMALVVASAALATAVWRRVGARGPQVRYVQSLWLALLLSLMLPAELLSLQGDWRIWTWPMLAGGGAALVPLIWVLGGVGGGRIHPLLVCYLLLVVIGRPPLQSEDLLTPHWILHRSRIFLGDVLNGRAGEDAPAGAEPWASSRGPAAHGDALWSEPAGQKLIFFTTGTEKPTRAWISLEGLLRDQMPPMENFIFAGEPSPIGLGSAVAVIIGGLFLLYRGLIDFRIPLLMIVAAFAALLILPIPVVITESAPLWRWLPMREPGVGPAAAITFANYEILAGPMLFTAFFLATMPAVRPMTRRGRAIYALLVGILAAGFQLYASVSFGPYLALLIGSLFTPLLDKLFRPQTLV